MIKQPVVLRDMQNSHVRDLVNRVTVAAHEVGGRNPDVVLLKEFGSWVKQNSWTDDTGWYVVFRPDPSWVFQRPDRAADIIREFLAHLDRMGLGSRLSVTLENDTPQSAVEVVYRNGTNSIGD